MNRTQLIEQLAAPDALQPGALVYHVRRKSLGIAIILCESLGGAWQSGDLVIFWDDGDHTDINLTDEIEFRSMLIPPPV